jgi:uncharacterized membrane protein YeaQ/YmgE (transglycosylase-associated protein family)
MNIMEQLIISLIAGAVGGNGAGAILKNLSLGTLGNSIIGILGGGLGTALLGMLTGGDPAAAAGGLDIGSIVSSLVSGGAGGGVLLAIVGVLKNMLAK